MDQLLNANAPFLSSLSSVMLIVNVLLHVIFASAVAKDAGRLSQLKISTWLVSGLVWAFATLLGGVWVAVVYWLMHHSTLTRKTL